MSDVTTQEPETSPSDQASEQADAASADPTPALELDCRGLHCPLPILKTKKALDGLEAGQILKMIATDPGSIADMTAFSRLTGHEVVQQSEGGSDYVFWIRKV